MRATAFAVPCRASCMSSAVPVRSRLQFGRLLLRRDKTSVRLQLTDLAMPWRLRLPVSLAGEALFETGHQALSIRIDDAERSSALYDDMYKTQNNG
jgi:hypothetical protein